MSVLCLLIQVTGTCKAFPEDMLKYLTTFLEPWFKTPNSATYQIAFKARNSSHNKRDEIIKSIAGTEDHIAVMMFSLCCGNSDTSFLHGRSCGKVKP